VGDGGGTLADGSGGHQRGSTPTPTRWPMRPSPVKLDTLREIDAFARALDPRVVQVSASLAASHQEVFILRPDGALVSDIRPDDPAQRQRHRRGERAPRIRQRGRRRADRADRAAGAAPTGRPPRARRCASRWSTSRPRPRRRA
jgi:predicted Zn-dependent protease